MAYRNLLVNDTVRITDMSDDHGQDGNVEESTGTGAKVRFYSQKTRQYVNKWFNARNLCIVRDAPEYVAPPVRKFKAGDLVQVKGLEESHKGVFLEYRFGVMSGVDTHIEYCYLTLPSDKVNGGWFEDNIEMQAIPQPIKEKEMPKITEGDRVRIINNNEEGFCRSSVGKIGTVEIDDGSQLPLLVRFDGCEDSDWGCYSEVELLVEPVETTTIKQKLEAIDKLVAEVRELLG